MAPPSDQDIRKAIGFMKRLARLMQKEPPKDDRLTDYATMIIERGFTPLLDEGAIRYIASRRSFFPDPREMIEDLTENQKARQPKSKGGRTLAEIHRAYGEAWLAITNEVLKELADDIAAVARTLDEGDRAHFRGLVTSEVQSLCSPLAQAIAAGRERPPFPHGRIDLVALARRTESQLHSTAGYEGRKNISWWERRYGPQVAAVETVADRKPAPEMVWSNPNAGPWTNPNK